MLSRRCMNGFFFGGNSGGCFKVFIYSIRSGLCRVLRLLVCLLHLFRCSVEPDAWDGGVRSLGGTWLDNNKIILLSTIKTLTLAFNPISGSLYSTYLICRTCSDIILTYSSWVRVSQTSKWFSVVVEKLAGPRIENIYLKIWRATLVWYQRGFLGFFESTRRSCIEHHDHDCR